MGSVGRLPGDRAPSEAKASFDPSSSLMGDEIPEKKTSYKPPPLEPKQRTLSDDENTDEIALKVVVCGDGASGKTSLCQRFARDAFDRDYHQTIGLDFFSRRITIPGENPVQVLMQVWDIGGQSIGSEMLPKYLAGAHCIVMVYDVTNRNSFDSLRDWLKEIKDNSRGQEKPPQLVLVGNKVDLDSQRVVTVDMHNNFAEANQLMAQYTSSRTGDSVLYTFRAAAAAVLKIQLSKADQEADIVVTKGEIAPDAIPLRARTRGAQSSGTSVCSIQ